MEEATEEAETTGTMTGVVDMVVVVGEVAATEESEAGEESSVVTGRTETGPMAETVTETGHPTETKRGPGTERETGGTVEGISRTIRATTPSTRGHNTTATNISQVLSVFIWTT